MYGHSLLPELINGWILSRLSLTSADLTCTFIIPRHLYLTIVILRKEDFACLLETKYILYYSRFCGETGGLRTP
jgi:hypothetical protein